MNPDIVVNRDIRYENGADPQIEAAFQAIADRFKAPSTRPDAE
ncbi:hypothetical protein [Chelativorans sp. AA-79]|nr:hypothetical protein [Chelativorans sp. AA-79]WEX10698.1 hypothetical protein PVE73_07075 [Chelativorans sp. AA-79]